MKDYQILIHASGELKAYIDKENERLKKEISRDSLDDPDYHDYQTCYELLKIAELLRVD